MQGCSRRLGNDEQRRSFSLGKSSDLLPSGEDVRTGRSPLEGSHPVASEACALGL